MGARTRGMKPKHPWKERTFASGIIGPHPFDLSAHWAGYVRCKAKSVRGTVFSGQTTASLTTCLLPRATAVIEITGHREGALLTCLHIGFSLADDLPPPGFSLTEHTALGTMCLPADCYMAVMQLAGNTKSHFQIGGDGKLNALSSDAPTIQRAMDEGLLGSYSDSL